MKIGSFLVDCVLDVSREVHCANSSFFFLGVLLGCSDVECTCSIIEPDKVCACTLNCISYLFLYLTLTILEV
jgi:hypothetical protein